MRQIRGKRISSVRKDGESGEEKLSPKGSIPLMCRKIKDHIIVGPDEQILNNIDCMLLYGT
jgi:hypothetical protein